MSTLRIVTSREPGAPAALRISVFCMAVGAAAADNYKQGGIVSPVNLETGTLGAAVRTDMLLRMLTFPTHPTTGTCIVGFQLPFSRDAVRLVLDARDRLGALAFVGWDVALLENGPVIVEANWNPGVKLTQMPHGIALGETEYAHCFAEHVDPLLRTTDVQELRRASLWEPFDTRRTVKLPG